MDSDLGGRRLFLVTSASTASMAFSFGPLCSVDELGSARGRGIAGTPLVRVLDRATS